MKQWPADVAFSTDRLTGGDRDRSAAESGGRPPIDRANGSIAARQRLAPCFSACVKILSLSAAVTSHSVRAGALVAPLDLLVHQLSTPGMPFRHGYVSRRCCPFPPCSPLTSPPLSTPPSETDVKHRPLLPGPGSGPRPGPSAAVANKTTASGRGLDRPAAVRASCFPLRAAGGLPLYSFFSLVALLPDSDTKCTQTQFDSWRPPGADINTEPIPAVLSCVTVFV